jgi:hypothetical protein
MVAAEFGAPEGQAAGPALIAQDLRPRVAHRGDPGAAGVGPGAGDRHRVETQRAALPGPRQRLREGRLEGSTVGAAEGDDGIAVGMRVRRDAARAARDSDGLPSHGGHR